MRAHVADYARRRDLIVGGLRELDYEVAAADGAFYVFPKVPAGHGTGHDFVARAIEHKLLIIPGGAFSPGTQTLATFNRNTWRESCHSFIYANGAIQSAGTYTARVTYTLSAP